MSKRNLLVFLTVYFIFTIFWSNHFLAHHDHKMGDSDLFIIFYHAARGFIENGLSQYLLPYYYSTNPPFPMMPPAQGAYTHLTSGPEYLQALISLLFPSSLRNGTREVQFQFIVNMTLNLFFLYLICKELARCVKIRTQHMVPASVVFFIFALLASSVMNAIMGFNPYVLATFFSNYVSLRYFRKYVLDQKTKYRYHWLFLTVFLAFWTGSSELPFAAVLIGGGLFLFKRPRQQIFMTGAIAVVAVTLALGLKFWQNYLHFGSLDALVADALATRDRRSVDTLYSFAGHLSKFGMRNVYLFGFALLPLLYLIKKRSIDLKLPGLILAAALIWQVIQPHHSYHHLYLLKSMTVFYACIGMQVYATRKMDKWVPLIPYLQIVLALVLIGKQVLAPYLMAN